MKMSLTEIRDLPIRYRHWYLERLKKELAAQSGEHKESNEPLNESQKAAIKAQLPAQVRRFT
jgi:hypothetical protein